MKRKLKCVKCKFKKGCFAYQNKVEDTGCYVTGYIKKGGKRT